MYEVLYHSNFLINNTGCTSNTFRDLLHQYYLNNHSQQKALSSRHGVQKVNVQKSRMTKKANEILKKVL